MIDLKGNPFYLADEDIRWVEETLASMSDDEKLGQLFCLVTFSSDIEFLKANVLSVKPGGMMCRPMPMPELLTTVKLLQDNSRIPMLIPANLEKGGNGMVTEGTLLGSPMQIAATSDIRTAWRLGEICGREGAAVGGNWAFAPIIDIDFNFRNPITNTRTFGSDPYTVRRMGVEYVRAVQQHGVAASIKHFPGDGVDERDQHLVTSINSLSCEDWDNTYGAAYQASIDAGALTVMAGHIAMPAWSKRLNSSLKDAEILPGSLAPEILNGLLRDHLGFNGLIVTDASTMAGMVIPMPRSQAVPQAIAAGCDMFLFTRNLQEDVGYMRQGINSGIITPERLHEALTRILALKAALKLHKKQAAGTLVPTLGQAQAIVGCEEHKAWTRECADKSITLVKEEKGVLPISPDKYKKVLFYAIEDETGFFAHGSGEKKASEKLVDNLRAEGFDIDVFDANKGMEGMMTPYSAITDRYDLILYLVNKATKSNQTVVRIEWAFPMGANAPVYLSSVPTVFISVENPYHLIDVPRVRTFINTYSSHDAVLESLTEKLLGRSEFKGTSPIDPFCGMWDTRL